MYVIRANKSKSVRIKVANTVEDHCNKMSKNVAFILNNEYLRENTIIARYEDVALSPRKFAQKMYSYFGIEMSAEISEWIEANTHGASQGSPDLPSRGYLSVENVGKPW